MKLTPTPLSLALCLKALKQEVHPHLPESSLEAQTSYKTIVAVIADLLARYSPKSHGTRPLLLSSLETGTKLERDLRAALKASIATDENSIVQDVAQLEYTTFEELSHQYEEMTTRICNLMQLVSAACVPESISLLRRAAEWEAAYYTQIPIATQGAMSSYYDDHGNEDNPKTSNDSSENELNAEAVEAFLRASRSQPRLIVTRLSRLAGGHGKQTYTCDVRDPELDGEENTTLVIRKEDASPIILRSTFRVAEEFALLRDLSRNTDFPCPRPFELAAHAPVGIDAPFYTMSKLEGAIGSTYLGSETYSIEGETVKQLAELLARLHSYPLDKFSGYFESVGEDIKKVKRMSVADRYRRSLENWVKYVKEVEHLPSPFTTWLLSWLRSHIPNDNRVPVLSHGDFSIHNLLQVDGDITGILDWETAEFLSPEQDLAYLQPLLSKSNSWDRFLEHYHNAGGPVVCEGNFPFAQAYAVLRTMLAFNRATRNLIVGDSHDVRFLMVEYGYLGAFMGLGLEYTSRHPSHAAMMTAAASINRLEGDDHQPAAVAKAVKPDTHGPQANALIVRGDDANVRQPVGSVPNWQNSVVLVWWDATQRIGGFHRLGHEPNRPGGGEAIIWTNLITPTGMFKRVQSNKLRAVDQPPDGSFGSGDDTCTVKYPDGEHIWTINEPTEGIKARIVHRDTGPNVDCFPKHGSMDNDFATAHFDIPGRVAGHLTMCGKTYDIEGLSIRDHAWGTRDWGHSAYGHRWLVGTAGETFSFMAAALACCCERPNWQLWLGGPRWGCDAIKGHGYYYLYGGG